MPELPDLVYIENKLCPFGLDREIREALVWEPIVLRMGVTGSFAETLPGKTITGLRRHGPFLVFTLPPLEMIVHFMLAGFFRVDREDLQAPKKQGGKRRVNKEHCFSLELEDRLSLDYFDSRRMGKISVLAWGIEEVDKAGRPIDVKVRGHLKVRNRKGEPCPVCGTTIRRAGVLGYDSFFCPKWQPERRSRLVSWDKLS
jgi:formamidopyrimidine-DNA glycosylase